MRGTLQKRSTRRSRVLLSGVLEASAGPCEVRIRDVSTDGALLEAATMPDVDEQVILVCGDAALGGRVAWADGSWFGVEFSEPLSGTLVDYTGNKLKVSAPRTYRRDKHQAEDPDDEIRTIVRLRDRLH